MMLLENKSIEELKNCCFMLDEAAKNDPDRKDLYETARDAILKAIPAPANFQAFGVGRFAFRTYYCPNCENFLQAGQGYCPKCGQALEIGEVL